MAEVYRPGTPPRSRLALRAAFLLRIHGRPPNATIVVFDLGTGRWHAFRDWGTALSYLRSEAHTTSLR